MLCTALSGLSFGRFHSIKLWRGGLLSVAFAIALGAYGDCQDSPVEPSSASNPAAGNDVLVVSIAIPLSGLPEQRVIQYRPWDIKGCNFHVVVTNKTDQPQRIFEDWNSWGYYALSFEVTDAAGKAWRIAKAPTSWTRNAPNYCTLPPHESLVIAVNFADTKVWSPNAFPRPKREPETYTMRAIFATAPTKESKGLSVWTGRAASKADQYTFYGGD